MASDGISVASDADGLAEGVAVAAPLAFGIFGDDVHDMEEDMVEEEDLAAEHAGSERVLVGVGADEAGLGQRRATGAKRGRAVEEEGEEEGEEEEEGDEGEEEDEDEVAMVGVGAGVRNDGEEDGEEDEDEVGEDEEDEEEEEEGLVFRTG